MILAEINIAADAGVNQHVFGWSWTWGGGGGGGYCHELLLLLFFCQINKKKAVMLHP